MGNSQEGGQEAKGVLHGAGKHHRGQVPGIECRVIQRKPVGGQKSYIEGDIMPYDGMSPDEVSQVVGHRGKGWGPQYSPGRDAGKPLDKLRDIAAGVDERPKYVDLVFALELDRADLDNSVAIGVEAGCLQVKGHEFLVKWVAFRQFLTLTQLGLRPEVPNTGPLGAHGYSLPPAWSIQKPHDWQGSLDRIWP